MKDPGERSYRKKDLWLKRMARGQKLKQAPRLCTDISCQHKEKLYYDWLDAFCCKECKARIMSEQDAEEKEFAAIFKSCLGENEDGTCFFRISNEDGKG